MKLDAHAPYVPTEAGERAVWPYLSQRDRIWALLYTPSGGGSKLINGRWLRADVWHPKPIEAP